MFLKGKKLSQKKAFLFLLILGFLIWSFKLFQTYLIFKGYKDPPPIIPYPTFFQYTAYALIAFAFPYSWNLSHNPRKRVVAVIAGGLVFVLAYIFVLNFLEWLFRFKEYNLLSGYLFSIYHSGLIVLLGYSVISLLLRLFVVTDHSTIDAPYLDRISYKLRNETFLVDVADIIYFESNDNYVSIHFQDGTYQLVRRSMGELEKQLDPVSFQRIHRKFIVNLSEVSSIKVNETGSTEIEVSNGRVLSVSKTYRSRLRASL